jgi:hypothetical protein
VIDMRHAARVWPAVALAAFALAGCGAHETTPESTSSAASSPAAEISLFPPPKPPPPPPPPPLSSLADGPVAAADLPVIVADRTYSGEFDGQPYAEYYGVDGTLRGKNGEQRYSGTWAVVGDQLCFTYPDSGGSAPACSSVLKNGDVITWTDSDGRALEVNSVEGNPEGL